ncbi:IucA/IucC family siderophore biosynthesis protein [Streptomyces tagetis]|uniref:IucA/IucC family siderophore biosynthesis protein n=1 Tax=Streptomyces tagetis TaxID=2820809 RepID=A0A940XC51_9ACTN|nr:IucA/IucC family siderophore biosynthesis protein [Streptomyces sp. RG38]MBQ0825451.1 IucA/IucC family siderophore biosynthesis protein [Streptomyces sp. RG38]
MHRPPTAEAEMTDELADVRPELIPAFTAGVPGARAEVLSRLWRALAHEPLPWIAGRRAAGDALVLRLRDGRVLSGPAADPYRTGAYVPVVHLDEVAYDDPARLMTDLSVPHSAAFAAELGHSAASLALARAGAPEIHPDEWPATDWGWEQRVVDGHPFHPGCRARPGFSVAEQLAYGPEHGPVVELALLPVDVGRCLVSGAWPEELRDGGRLLLPVHPWQATHVLKRRAGEDADAGRAGQDVHGRRAGEGADGRPAGLPHERWGGEGADGRLAGLPRVRWGADGHLAAHPLMSLRTLAVPGGPHVKTALSARLTSSVRDISVASITSSAAVSAFGQQLAAHTDGLLRVTRTLGAATADSPDLAAVLRESPREYAAPGEHVVPVAALAGTGLPASPGWAARLARLTLTVALRLLELGVALEAHGQNLLVVLSASGEPLRLVYRDLADIRVSPARLARHGLTAPALPARMLTDDPVALRRKLFGSLVGGALAGAVGSGEALRAALEPALRDAPRTDDARALGEEPLPVKALTLMRLSPGRAGDLWTELPNPVTGRPVPAPDA